MMARAPAATENHESENSLLRMTEQKAMRSLGSYHSAPVILGHVFFRLLLFEKKEISMLDKPLLLLLLSLLFFGPVTYS